MCGIAGLLHFDGQPIDPDALRAMGRALIHRGPDGEGYAWLGATAEACGPMARDPGAAGPASTHAGFAHTRLAILDLSPAGLQPMRGPGGASWITYNGEIFNYRELRAELESLGRRFTTETDTEVLLHAYDAWGPDCLARLNGMWAFAVWDTRQRVLFLARDRFGIKPLYYSAAGPQFAFASEPKALLPLPWVSRAPDTRAVADYLVHGRVDCFAWTFFEGIQRLEPGHSLTVPFDTAACPAPHRWWRLEDALVAPPADAPARRERFRDLFASSVRLRLRSDVPLGTCLSGGLDSTAVMCVARPWLAAGDQKAYSAVYDRSFTEDETAHIETVVRATGVDSIRVTPTAEALREELDALLACQDEPFASTSIFAQYKVFQRVRATGTTVTLDGQGADEMLAGYDYFFPVHIAALVLQGRLATARREMAAYCAHTGTRHVRAVLATAAAALDHRTMIRLASYYDPARSVRWVRSELHAIARTLQPPPSTIGADRLTRRLHEVFAVSGLPALLRYEDRNSMAFSVEARLPFLDHRLVAYAFSLPATEKIRDGWTKYILREALADVLPPSIRTRTDKVGFSTPESTWFRQALLPLAREVCTDATTGARGFVDQSRLTALLDAHVAGRVDAARPLWRAVNLELWCRRAIDGV